MTVIRQVDRKEVMSHFIPIEREKMNLPPMDCSAKSIKELEDEVHTLCKGVIPFERYSVGFDTDHRNDDIVQWVLGTIPVHELYSCGVNPETNAILRGCNWNLSTACSNLPCPQMSKAMDETKEIIVTIKQDTPEKKGRFEVIDGFHRAMAMIREGRKEVCSYIGLHKKDGISASVGQKI